jgi:hypothetical protein
MNALVFLGVAVVVSVIGSLIVLARNRSPRSIDHGIDDFAQRMQALSPDQAARADDRPTPEARPIDKDRT